MANNQNLIPQAHKITVEEASKGGKRSAEVRREKKKLKEQLELLLSLPMVNGKNKNKIKNLGLEETEINNKMAINYALFTQAMKGNVKAYELIQETIGEKPTGNEPSKDDTNSKIENIAYLLNNPRKVRTEEDLENE